MNQTTADFIHASAPRELIRRLVRRPGTAGDLFLASLCTNLLILADTIYVMIILRRYIAYGFNGTLFVLTAGALAALALQWALLRTRTRIAADISAHQDSELSDSVFNAIAHANYSQIASLPKETTVEAASDLAQVEEAFGPAAVTAFMDAPFILLFTVAIYFLEPMLAMLTLVGVGLTFAASIHNSSMAAHKTTAFTQARGALAGVASSAAAMADTVRLFSGTPHYRNLWNKQLSTANASRKGIQDSKSISNSLTMGSGVLTRSALYAVGAKLAVDGGLSVAALIGVSILGTQAMTKTSACVQAWGKLRQAQLAAKRLAALTALDRSQYSGSTPKTSPRDIRIRDLSFTYGQQVLFENLDVHIPAGSVLVIQGNNGSGKTTLLRLLAGLLHPTRGAVEIDGEKLDSYASQWWRKQVCYMPQEPYFLAASIQENLTAGVPDIPDNKLRALTNAAGLRHFLDTSDKGLETRLSSGGRTLPIGIRKRLALVRALAVNGPLVFLDEPTDGLDAQGCQAVYSILNQLAKSGKTIVAVSYDPNITKGASAVLDLSAPEGPSVQYSAPTETS